MRPLRLEIEGLTSFRQSQAIDFSGFDLFVIVGPTGSGKSTILDAIALALYGQIPRMRGRGDSDKELVTHGETRARIMLEFQAGEDTFRVARQLPRRGAQRATLERWLGGDDWATALDQGGVRAVNAKIEEIVGLDFPSFTRSVLLPQGDFAEFLSGDAAERRRILVRLLNLDRYIRAGQLASQRARDLDATVTATEQLLQQEYDGITDEAVAAAEKAAKSARTRAAKLAKGLTRVEALHGALKESEALRAAVARCGESLAEAARKLDGIDQEWRQLEPRQTELEVDQNKATADLAAAVTTYRSAAAELEVTRARTGDQAFLARMEAACEAMAATAGTTARLVPAIAEAEENLNRLEGNLAKAEARLAAAQQDDQLAKDAEDRLREEADAAREALRLAREKALAEQRMAKAVAEEDQQRLVAEQRYGALDKAEAAAAEAERHLSHLRGEHDAIAIRVGLAVGEPCPVCLQAIAVLPAGGGGGAVDDLLRDAKTASSGARAAWNQAREASHHAATAHAVATQAVDQARAVLAGLGEALPLAAAEAAMATTAARRQEAQARRTEAAAVLATARESREQLATAVASARARLSADRQLLADAHQRYNDASIRLGEAFPDGIPADVRAAIAARKGDLDAATNAEAGARQKRDVCLQARDKAAASAQDFAQQVDRVRNKSSTLRGSLGALINADTRARPPLSRLPAQGATPAAEIDALRRWLGKANAVVREGQDRAEEAVQTDRRSWRRRPPQWDWRPPTRTPTIFLPLPGKQWLPPTVTRTGRPAIPINSRRNGRGVRRWRPRSPSHASRPNSTPPSPMSCGPTGSSATCWLRACGSWQCSLRPSSSIFRTSATA